MQSASEGSRENFLFIARSKAGRRRHHDLALLPTVPGSSSRRRHDRRGNSSKMWTRQMTTLSWQLFDA